MMCLHIYDVQFSLIKLSMIGRWSSYALEQSCDTSPILFTARRLIISSHLSPSLLYNSVSKATMRSLACDVREVLRAAANPSIDGDSS
jgi:hypothetical protein